MTDYLVRRHEAKLVVRFNGGTQAGHNVRNAGGREHTFSQLGAGSFVSGVRTHLASPVVVHPTALLIEAQQLAGIGESGALARLSVDPGCLVTTPFHQAANRLRELRSSGDRHGSCGVGVGETKADALAMPELAVRFGELLHPERLSLRLEALRNQKLAEFSPTAGAALDLDTVRELALLRSEAVSERWLALAASVARAVRTMHCEPVPASTRSPSLTSTRSRRSRRIAGASATAPIPNSSYRAASLSKPTLTEQLFRVAPSYTTHGEPTPEAICQQLSERAGVPVRYGSAGPSSAAVRERKAP